MTTRFKSQYSEHDAFYLRGDLLRSAFGNWDACDPVAHCILVKAAKATLDPLGLLNPGVLIDP
jgi:FAD/FMN-containing dehydrogenase